MSEKRIAAEECLGGGPLEEKNKQVGREVTGEVAAAAGREQFRIWAAASGWGLVSWEDSISTWIRAEENFILNRHFEIHNG